ncbi:insulinase family protein [Novosphingobium sp. KCTC 2891]|uniref:M16 family metallopeptidase n=1 Tax=Novosphingobium sp. KCTC 2891 TaxID=2989730 RepID=UPI002222A624|nr:M16 family metallopeptidase [Novosphingobium sp. KCTC 2891]MCW1382794.1 insulinase family protein [Novosphingobium sp. KCTC 2891]
MPVRFPFRSPALFAVLLLAACAPRPAALPPAPKPDWAFQQSDLTPDPAYRFGKLANGMRFVIRRNATPPGTAVVRMDVNAGSLDERPEERGFAHYVEHMAFNGSTRVPEGEMVKLLERSGLSFGADTNAQTSFEQTLYMLDLPRADPALLDTALMLMRETASELKFDPAAVARERGVVLSELRDGQGYALDNLKDQIAFLYPQATYRERLPIGTVETLNAANADGLKAFWQREYVPSKTTLMVVGDFDPDAVEAAIRARFEDWRPAPETPRPGEGKVLAKQKDQADVWIAPALSERVSASRHGPWLDEPDSAATRRTNLLRQIGYGIVNRRFQRLSRQVAPPFRGAGFGTSDVFRIGRTTNLIVDTPDGGWKTGLTVAARTLAEALRHGFTEAEVAEQVANVRTGIENAAASADTRSNGALVQSALALVRDEQVPTTPQSGLERFNRFAPQITPAAVLAALKSEAVPLKAPLLRFQGRKAPEGGAKALRQAWNHAAGTDRDKTAAAALGSFAYTDFGTAGTVVADRTDPALGIRTLRFANGLRLNLKRTALETDRIQVRLAVDGGELLETKADPLAVDMTGMLAGGGLGKHSQDDLQTLLAGRSVSNGIAASGDVFVSGATTTRRDLELQLQLLAATVTDPGYRPEAEVLFRQNMANFFARRDATPGSALSNALGGLLSDNDPRFTLQKPEDYQALTFAKLRDRIGDRLAKGAIEIALVGDFDEAQAIALVARTFGALPPREPDFLPYAEARERTFTAQRSLRVVRHKGVADQAIVRVIWPTTDDTDPLTVLKLELLKEITGIEVLDTVREKLGKSYSPGASSAMSRVWRGYGTFAVQASVDVADVAPTRTALAETVAGLIAAPVDADVLQRARAPMLERLDNALKSNAGWLGLIERAQSHPDRIERFLKARERLAALTPADVQATARQWLAAKPVTVLVLPESAPAPAD